MTAQMAARPGGKVCEVFDDPAEREAAFRFVENDDVSAKALGAAAHRATARRAAGMPWVFVPVDGSSLAITDKTKRKGLGVVGSRSVGATGLQVMSAIGVSPDGVPLGMLGQSYWPRVERSTATDEKADRRPTEEKETRFWLETMSQTRVAMAAVNPTVRPWFQLDRGGDAYAVLADGSRDDCWITVRGEYDRRLVSDSGPEHLWAHVSRQNVLGAYVVDVPATPKRKARRAHMLLQACLVTLDLVDLHTRKHLPATLWAVRAVEEGTRPKGEDRLEWLLLTTYPASGLEAAELVVAGYATRWRIEQFHRTWKTGACNVEDTQLRGFDHIVRWATLQGSVAMRILRLTYFARTAPELPATTELSTSEVEATILLRKPPSVPRKSIPPIGQVVRWIAELGGYTGKSSGGPPGSLVIARGLDRIASVAQVLDDGAKL